MILEGDWLSNLIGDLSWIIPVLAVLIFIVKIISKIKIMPRAFKKEMGKEIFQESMFLLAKFAMEYEPIELYEILKRFARQSDLKDDMHATIETIADVFKPEGAFKDNTYFKKLDDEKRAKRYKILTKRKKWAKIRYSEKMDDALGKVWELWWANRRVRIMEAEQKSNRENVNKIIKDIEDKKMSNREKRKSFERRREKEQRKRYLAEIKSKGDDLHEIFNRKS